MFSCKTDKHGSRGPQGKIGPTGPTGPTGMTGPAGQLPSPSMNAVLPYEPWHLDNTNKSFLPINISGYYIQFFAPTSGYYTNMKLYADISNSEFYSGTIGVAIYKNNPVDETGPPINQQTPIVAQYNSFIDKSIGLLKLISIYLFLKSSLLKLALP